MTSRITYPGAGTLYAIPFPYLDPTHVKVKVDNVELDTDEYSFPTSGTVQLVTDPGSADVLIYRDTPEEPLTVYQSGSVLSRGDLETDSLQALYRIEEVEDIVPDFPDVLIPGAVPMVNDEGTGYDWALAGSDPDALASLALGTGSALIGFTQDGVGANPRTLEEKSRDFVSVLDFMSDAERADALLATPVLDHTASIHKFFDYIIANNRRGYFPPGQYRVTSGYTANTAYHDFVIYGDGFSREPVGGYRGTWIILDSVDPASFFFKADARIRVDVNRINFRCAQEIQDRKFFWWAANMGLAVQECAFQDVEIPFWHANDSYVQVGLYRLIQWRGVCGTINCEDNLLNGTLLSIIDCNHDGSACANTPKIVCDLSGFRQVQVRNLLLEGAFPGFDGTGWTVLKIDSPAEGGTTQLIQVNGFWSEWSGTFEPDYAVHVVNGSATFINPGAFNGKIRVGSQARVVIRQFNFTDSADFSSHFTLDGDDSTVVLETCGFSTYQEGLLDKRFLIRDGQINGIDAEVKQALVDNGGKDVIASFDGGYFDPGRYAVTAGPGSWTPSTDATYGRKILIDPGAGGTFFTVDADAAHCEEGDSFVAVVKFKLPTFTGGNILVKPRLNGAEVSGRSYAFADSEQVKTAILPFRARVAPTSIGFQFGTSGVSGLAGVAEIYYLEITRGPAFSRRTGIAYPSPVVSFGTAAPTIGAWAVGDRIINSAPAVGSPKAWACTVAGTPGTWVSEGNL